MQFTFEHDASGLNLKQVVFHDKLLNLGFLVDGTMTGFSGMFPIDNPYQELLWKFREGNSGSTEYEAYYEYGFPKELRYSNTLFDERIIFSPITLSDVLSEDFNEENTDWREMTDLKKTARFFKILQFLYLAYYYVPNILRGFFLSKYLPTTREIPERKYMLINGSFEPSNYYGFLNELKSSGTQEEINKLLKIVGIESQLVVNTDENTGTLTLQNIGSTENIHESSSGIIQLLPILIACSILSDNKHSLNFNPSTFPTFSTLHNEYFLTKFAALFIEQPELHLHPKLQSSFAKVLKETIDRFEIYGNINIFIETHSEHLIRKIQVLIAKDELDRKKVGVWYFIKVDGVTKVEKMEIDENGLFKHDWPDGFFDDSIELTMELFEALRKRKN